MKRFAALLLFATSAAAVTITPGDIADAPGPPCCIGEVPLITYLRDNHGTQKATIDAGYQLAFGPNGHLFISAAGDIGEYDTSLVRVRTFARPGGTSALTVAQNGNVLALAFNNTVTVHSPPGAALQTFSIPFTAGPGITPPSFDLGADQCTLFYTDGAQTGRRFDVCNQVPLPNLAPGAWSAVRAMSDGGYVAAQGATLSVYDSQNRLLRTLTPQIPDVRALAFDADPSFILAGTIGNIARVRLSDGLRIDSFGDSPLYLAVNGEQRASAAVFATDVPTLSPALLLALALGIIALAWQRLRG